LVGYSIGTGLATHLAMHKNVKLLILQTPYYSLSEVMSDKAPFVPAFIKRYTIETNRFIKDVSAPIYIFHGTADELITYSHSERLIRLAKATDTLIPVTGGGHDMMNNAFLNQELKRLLE
jgi:hypothetical protein